MPPSSSGWLYTLNRMGRKFLEKRPTSARSASREKMTGGYRSAFPLLQVTGTHRKDLFPPQPVSQPLWMRVRKAWHTVGRRSGRSLMAMPRVRASPLKAPSTSVGWVQKPGSRVQTWKAKEKVGGYIFAQVTAPQPGTRGTLWQGSQPLLVTCHCSVS